MATLTLFFYVKGYYGQLRYPSITQLNWNSKRNQWHMERADGAKAWLNKDAKLVAIHPSNNDEVEDKTNWGKYMEEV